MFKLLLLMSALAVSGDCFSSMADPKSKPSDPEETTLTKNPDLSENAPLPVRTESVSGDELICKRERVTGTHIAKKVCRTRQQVEAEREAAEHFMRRTKITPGAVPQG